MKIEFLGNYWWIVIGVLIFLFAIVFISLGRLFYMVKVLNRVSYDTVENEQDKDKDLNAELKEIVERLEEVEKTLNILSSLPHSAFSELDDVRIRIFELEEKVAIQKQEIEIKKIEKPIEQRTQPQMNQKRN